MAKKSVHAVIRNAAVTIKDPNFDLIDFLNTYPAQVSEEREGEREREYSYYIFLFITYFFTADWSSWSSNYMDYGLH